MSNAEKSMSNTERKRALRKKRKEEKRIARFEQLVMETSATSTDPSTLATTDSLNLDQHHGEGTCATSNNDSIPQSRNTTTNRSGGGKASRARRARNGECNVGTGKDHNPCGSGPPPNHHEYRDVIRALDALEARARRAARPEMVKRQLVLTDNHGSMESSNTRGTVRLQKHVDCSTGICSLAGCNLRSFSISQIPSNPLPNSQVGCSLITYLDLSRNEIWELPDDLSALYNLATLDLSRNWFVTLPPSVSTLRNLVTLNVSSNDLEGTRESLQIDKLQTLSRLSSLDLSINKRCGRQDLANLIRTELPQIDTLHMTITYPRPPGTFVGDTPADRDATLLRSQLEPWSTCTLRRRLVADFGADLPAQVVPRVAVMEQLLQLYHEESITTGRPARTVVQIEGTRIDELLAEELLTALRLWSRQQAKGGNVERPSISAQNYMILTSPAELALLQSKNAYKSVLKLDAHRNLWDLAQTAMLSVDPVFATKYTALAVTQGFQGSPHIDRQNSAAFYGLSLGTFEEGTGGIFVECSARIVTYVHTKNRLAKVDGRHPHWVAPYDHENAERYSLIFYQTVGEREPVGPAIFQIPTGRE